MEFKNIDRITSKIRKLYEKGLISQVVCSKVIDTLYLDAKQVDSINEEVVDAIYVKINGKDKEYVIKFSRDEFSTSKLEKLNSNLESMVTSEVYSVNSDVKKLEEEYLLSETSNIKYSKEITSDKSFGFVKIKIATSAAVVLTALALSGCSNSVHDKSADSSSQSIESSEASSDGNNINSQSSEEKEKQTNVNTIKRDGYYNNYILDYTSINDVFNAYRYSDQLDNYQIIVNQLTKLNVVRVDDEESLHEIVGGLTVEQARALYIYLQSTSLKPEEMIRNIGLDIEDSKVSDKTVDAFLSLIHLFGDVQIDENGKKTVQSGQALELLIEDQGARDLFDEVDTLRVKMLTSDKKSQEFKDSKKAFEAIFLNILDARHPYHQYMDHPVIQLLAVEYTSASELHDITFDKNTTRFMHGKTKEEVKSKVDAVCANVFPKLEEIEEFAEKVKDYLETADLESLDYANLDEATKFAIDNYNLTSYNSLTDQEKLKVDSVMSTDKGCAAFVHNKMFSNLALDRLAEKEVFIRGYGVENQTEYFAYVIEELAQRKLSGQTGNKNQQNQQQSQEESSKQEVNLNQEQAQNVPGKDGQSAEQQQQAIQQQLDQETQGQEQQAQQAVLNFEQAYTAVVNYFYQNPTATSYPDQNVINFLSQYQMSGGNAYQMAMQTGIARYYRDHPITGGQDQIESQYQETATDISTQGPTSQQGQQSSTSTSTSTSSQGSSETSQASEQPQQSVQQTQPTQEIPEIPVGTVIVSTDQPIGQPGQTGGQDEIDPEYADAYIEGISTDAEPQKSLGGLYENN